MIKKDKVILPVPPRETMEKWIEESALGYSNFQFLKLVDSIGKWFYVQGLRDGCNEGK